MKSINLFRYFTDKRGATGFTLVEVLVVAAITGVITTFMLINFQRTRLDLNESAGILMGDIKAVQAKANASARFDDGTGLAIRCGYGIHYEDSTSYSVYTGPNATTTNCPSENRNYDANDFKILPLKKFIETRIEFGGAFPDIFFEPPSPTTFLNNSSASGAVDITIKRAGGTCPQDCKIINVSSTGKIE